MCLAVPHRIIKLNGDGSAVAEAGPIQRDIRVDLLANPAVGDLVMVHAGFAIEKIREQDAAELLDLWKQIRMNAGAAGELPF